MKTNYVNRMARYTKSPLQLAADDMLFLDAMRRAQCQHWMLRDIERHAEAVLKDQCHTDEAERRN